MDEPDGTVGGHLDLTTTAPVAGGASLARDGDGRVVFVAGALPGERVRAEVTETRKDFARARVVAVLDPSPDRVEPPCPFVAVGCGGCDLQHVRPEAQAVLKRAIVVDALRRIGRLPTADELVHLGPALPAAGYRTTVRGAVRDGRFGFRAAASHDVVEVERCLVAHPLVDELIHDGRFGAVDEVTIRAGARTGERLVLASSSVTGVEVAPDAIVVGRDQLDEHPAPWFHEIVEGTRLRIGAMSFFQARPDGADALVALVRDLGGDELQRASHVVDAYAGVGLFSATAVPPEARVTAVEWNRSSVADARVNLADRDAVVRRSDVAQWHPEPADIVIADPARTGLGKRSTAVLAGTEASVLVLVSCDPAALARDVTLLAGHGYELVEARVVDLFPHTHHVEVVSRFVRRPPP
jgi:23S rRNA (uracil1939-C5)-methyltransferase